MAITIKDIAKQADVSVSTVSVVLRGATNPMISAITAEKVKRIAVEMGYRPNLAARNLRAQKTYTVGMVVHLTRGLPTRLIVEAERILREGGFDLLLGFSDNTPEREWRYIDKLYGVRVDGLLIAPSRYEEERSLERYRAIPAPLVLFDGPAAPDFCCAKKDRAEGVAVLARHLYRLGRRRIALSLVHDMGYGNRERLEGYRRALAELNLVFDAARLLYSSAAPVVSGAELMAPILAHPGEIDAVICGDDHVAGDLITALLEAGVSVPDKVAVVGFNDAGEFSEKFSVPITTLRHGGMLMMQKACEFLLERMNVARGKPQPPPVHYSPEPTLVVRRSCGAPPAS